MQIYLKIKIGIITLSVMVITYIILYDNGFYQKSTIKEWSGLKWSDFKGIVKPLSPSDASIHTDIYIKYDSLNKKYLAYAGQNNKLSWKRNGMENNTVLLRHEQYHFNITEHFSRRMNKVLNKPEIKNTGNYELELKNIREKLSEMQDKYDYETDHGLNDENQINWENKIDRLLE